MPASIVFPQADFIGENRPLRKWRAECEQCGLDLVRI